MKKNTSSSLASTDDATTRRGRMQARRARHAAQITAYPATRSAAMVVLPSPSVAPAATPHTQAAENAAAAATRETQLQPVG